MKNNFKQPAPADPKRINRREAIGGLAGLGLSVALGGCSSPGGLRRHHDNAVVRENQLPGTRDGLHPNTCLQSIIARRIVDTFNQAYATAIPAITDAEILNLIGVDPRQSYFEWVAANALSAAAVGDDGDGDGFANLAEFVFDLDPTSASAGPLTIAATGGPAQVRFHPNPDRQRLVDVVAEWGIALGTWASVPLGNLTTAPDGKITNALPGGAPSRFVRLQISLKPVN